MKPPTIEDMWLIVRALHRDLDRINGRIAKLEESLLPMLGDDRVVVRLPDDEDPPGWLSPSAEPAPRSDPAWRSASGS